MKKIAALFATGLIASTLLAGCGASPTATQSPSRSSIPTNRLASGNLGSPTGGAATGGASDQATQQLLQQVRQMQSTTQGFKATVETWEKAGSKTSTSTLKIAYAKPMTMRLDISKSSDTQAVGVKLRWEGGSEFKIKPTWMPFAVGVGIDDKRVISLNNWTIKQTDVTCILNVLLDPSTKVKVLDEKGNFDGQILTAVEAVSPKSPTGVTREIVGIDRATGMPKARRLYKGDTLVYKLNVKSLSPGKPSESELSM